MMRPAAQHKRLSGCHVPLVWGCLASLITVLLQAAPAVAGAEHACAHESPSHASDAGQARSPAGYSAGVLNLRARPPQLCFAPGTPAEVTQAVDQMTAFWDGRDAFQFADIARWTSTAYQPGGTLSQGDPTTLSWSIVPDGTSIAAFNPAVGESNDPSNLIASLDGIYGGAGEPNLQFKPWFHIVEEVFARWGELTGNTYIYETNDDGRRFGAITWPGVISVRGDIRIGGHAIDGDSGVLAYNFFPDVGNMVLDTADNFYENVSNDSQRLRNVLLHEHGHGLGISHVCPVEQTKLMEPFFSSLFLGPQFDDILAAQRGYGDPNEPNDDSSLPTYLGALGNGSHNVTGVSIDDESDADWYRIDLQAGKRLTVTVNPVGAIYLNGPQNLNGSCTAGEMFDALIQQDLGVGIIGTDGVTVLAQADVQPAGGAETIVDLDLGGGPGGYFIRVIGTTLNKVQMYELDFAVADTPLARPKLIAASSRKLHGQSGSGVEYDLSLALSGDPTVEPRKGGADRIVLEFDSPVSMVCADVLLATAACDAVTDLGDGTTWEIELSATVPNSCETLTLQTSLGLDPASPATVQMLNILGDVDQSGEVNVLDLSKVKSGIVGLAAGHVDETNFVVDVDVSNGLNVIDLSVVKSNIAGFASCAP